MGCLFGPPRKTTKREIHISVFRLTLWGGIRFSIFKVEIRTTKEKENEFVASSLTIHRIRVGIANRIDTYEQDSQQSKRNRSDIQFSLYP
jgi:hypothetical protein